MGTGWVALALRKPKIIPPLRMGTWKLHPCTWEPVSVALERHRLAWPRLLYFHPRHRGGGCRGGSMYNDASADLDGDEGLAFLFQTGPLWKEKIL